MALTGSGPVAGYYRAMRLQPGAVISFVGGGGKTTAMFRLAGELAASGHRVVATTTTHISEIQASFAPASVTAECMDDLPALLEAHRMCLITGQPDGKGRLSGVSLEAVADLHARRDVDIVLVEADGSRGLPFKAPGDHEPVVPTVTTHLVPVVGVEIIGQTLDAQHVHRPGAIAQLSGVPLGSPITAGIVASVLAHPGGGAKHRPPSAQLVPLLNKVESPDRKAPARAIAELMLAEPNVNSIILGAMSNDPPVREVWSRVAGIVLAAGRSERFGVTKQTLRWGDTTLVGHAARVGLDAGLKPLIVITGHDAEGVLSAIADLPVQAVFNPDFAAGLSTSVRCGIAALPQGTGAAVFLLADQPGITPMAVQSVVETHRQTVASIVVPTYHGRRGNPVLFDTSLFPELRELGGDTGGRSLFAKYQSSIVNVDVDVPGILRDIDTPEDYEQAVREA